MQSFVKFNVVSLVSLSIACLLVMYLGLLSYYLTANNEKISANSFMTVGQQFYPANNQPMGYRFPDPPLQVATTGTSPLSLSKSGGQVVLANQTVILERVIYTSELNSTVQILDGNGNLLAPAQLRALSQTTISLDLGVLALNGVVFRNTDIYGNGSSTDFQIAIYYRIP